MLNVLVTAFITLMNLLTTFTYFTYFTYFTLLYLLTYITFTYCHLGYLIIGERAAFFFFSHRTSASYQRPDSAFLLALFPVLNWQGFCP